MRACVHSWSRPTNSSHIAKQALRHEHDGHLMVSCHGRPSRSSNSTFCCSRWQSHAVSTRMAFIFKAFGISTSRLRHYAGEDVVIRYDLRDMAELRVYFGVENGRKRTVASATVRVGQSI